MRVGKRWNGLPRQVTEPPPQEMLKAQLEQPWTSCCSQPSLRACSPRLPFCWNWGAATLCHLLHRRLAQNEAPLAVLRREHGPCCRQRCKYRTKKQAGVQCGQSPCCHLEIARFFNRWESLRNTNGWCKAEHMYCTPIPDFWLKIESSSNFKAKEKLQGHSQPISGAPPNSFVMQLTIFQTLKNKFPLQILAF